MKKIFLATSFSGQVDDKGEILPEYKKYVNDIIVALRENYDVFCAAEYEGWQYYHSTAEAGVEKDLEEIDKADILLALLHEKISGGIHIEIGYALGRSKEVILVTNGNKLSYFTGGLADLHKVAHLEYRNPKVLAEQVEQLDSSKPA